MVKEQHGNCPMAESHLHWPRWKEEWFRRLNGGLVDFFFFYGRIFHLDFWPSSPLIPELRFLMVKCVNVWKIFARIVQGGPCQERMGSWPFTVTFNTCITLITSHCFDLSCFHTLTEDNDRFSPWESGLWLATGSLYFVNLFSGVLSSKTFFHKKDY